MRPLKVKKPLFNHTSASCVICTQKHDKEKTQFSPDWFTYMCVECMNEHAKRWGFEFEKDEIDQ